MTHKNIPLTAAEIGNLWNYYMSESMSYCILKFMLKHLEDEEIKLAVEFAYDLSSTHLEQLYDVFQKEEYAVPNGFTNQDVNMEAPWLFSDIFCLNYLNNMAKIAMVTHSGFVSMSTREDIAYLFTQGLTEASNLYNKVLKIGLEKGINSRHPFIEVPRETDYVDSKKYFSGLNPFSKHRPLNSIEISHLYMNILTNTIGEKLCISFAQTSPTKEVQDFMLRAKDISQKHKKIFISTLMEDEIQAPQSPDISVSDSTTKTFSDKLMMFHMSLLTAAGTGNYATAAAASQRSDLAVNYERLSLETAKLAKSGADIMIKYNWLEQPPGTPDREKLARNKGEN